MTNFVKMDFTLARGGARESLKYILKFLASAVKGDVVYEFRELESLENWRWAGEFNTLNYMI